LAGCCTAFKRRWRDTGGASLGIGDLGDEFELALTVALVIAK
jgi:hypothetical protein